MVLEFGRTEALTEFKGDISTLLLTCVVQHIGHLIINILRLITVLVVFMGIVVYVRCRRSHR